MLIKNNKQIELLDIANKITNEILGKIEASIEPEITTKQLENIAYKELSKIGVEPAFKNYNGFPSCLCVSINEEIVHGIPSNKKIKETDIISIDFGVIYRGFYGDAARTIVMPEASEKAKKLSENTKKALMGAIEFMYEGKWLSDISKAIDEIAQKNNYGNIKKFCGHGVGSKLHEYPKVFNYLYAGYKDLKLQEGMVLAIEPMFSLGSDDSIVLDDKWTAITADKSLSAHWEYSVAITKNGPKILGV